MPVYLPICFDLLASSAAAVRDHPRAIIESYIERLHDEVGRLIHYSDGDDVREYVRYENLVASLEHYLAQKYYILLLYDNGFGTLIQEKVNEFAEEFLGDMPSRSIDRYKLYFLSGGMFNMLVRWLKEGAPESPGQMARSIMSRWEDVRTDGG